MYTAVEPYYVGRSSRSLESLNSRASGDNANDDVGEFETRLSRTRGQMPPLTLLYSSVDGDADYPLTSLPRTQTRSEPRSTSHSGVAYMGFIFGRRTEAATSVATYKDFE